jgi:hypothetical protein
MIRRGTRSIRSGLPRGRSGASVVCGQRGTRPRAARLSRWLSSVSDGLRKWIDVDPAADLPRGLGASGGGVCGDGWRRGVGIAACFPAKLSTLGASCGESRIRKRWWHMSCSVVRHAPRSAVPDPRVVPPCGVCGRCDFRAVFLRRQPPHHDEGSRRDGDGDGHTAASACSDRNDACSHGNGHE